MPAIIGKENPSKVLSSTAPMTLPMVRPIADGEIGSPFRVAAATPVKATTTASRRSAPVPTRPVSTRDNRYWLSKIW
jgi:hypothetical protein